MMIRTVEDFVKQIGGNSSAATAFDVSAPAICNWKADGRFPAWAFMRVREIAEVNKLTVDPKLFVVSRPTRVKLKRKSKNHHAA